jgi:adenine-specific DNA-methyltransferase
MAVLPEIPGFRLCKAPVGAEDLLFEADNLEALIALRSRFEERFDLLYLDPPYNTGHAFAYQDRFGRGVKGHGWRDFVAARLRAAASLLSEHPLVLASIDDHELVAFRDLLDEVFGQDRFIGTLVWRSRRIVDSRNKSGLSSDHEYVLVYGDQRLRGRPIDVGKYANPDHDPRGPWMSDNMTGLATASQRPNLHYDLLDPETGRLYACPPRGWRYDRAAMAQKVAEGRVLWPSSPAGRPRHKRFLAEVGSRFTGLSSLLDLPAGPPAAHEVRDLVGEAIIDFPKPLALMRLLIDQATGPRSLVLDPFAGSGTTGQAVMEANAADGGKRRFVLIQSPEPTGSPRFPTLADLCRARLDAAAARLGCLGPVVYRRSG